MLNRTIFAGNNPPVVPNNEENQNSDGYYRRICGVTIWRAIAVRIWQRESGNYYTIETVTAKHRVCQSKHGGYSWRIGRDGTLQRLNDFALPAPMGGK